MLLNIPTASFELGRLILKIRYGGTARVGRKTFGNVAESAGFLASYLAEGQCIYGRI